MFTKDRIAALVLALTVVFRCYLAKGTEGLTLGFLICFLSLPLILFPEQINQITMGMGGIRGPKINKETPGCIIAFLGWGLLLFFSILIGVKFRV